MIFGYSRIFGYHFLVKFDFFKNNPDFGVLILIFPSMTLWNVACRALVSYFLCIEKSGNSKRIECLSNDSTVLVSVLLCLCTCKEFHIVYNCYQFEFVYQ